MIAAAAPDTQDREIVETPSGKWRDGENFPVGSLLIRRDLRVHVHAFYRFARNADDIADNPELCAADENPPARPHGGGARRRPGRRFASRFGDAPKPGRDRNDGAALQRRFARLPPGRRKATLSRLGRADGILPLFGLAGRAAAARSASAKAARPGPPRTRCARHCRCSTTCRIAPRITACSTGSTCRPPISLLPEPMSQR